MSADQPRATTVRLGDLAEPAAPGAEFPPTRPDVPDLVLLGADTPLLAAARAAVDRPAPRRGEPIGVSWPDGRSGVVAVDALLAAVVTGSSPTDDHDRLTGLHTRTGFVAEAERILGAGTGPAALLVLNLDRFKEINNAYGAETGDRVLREVGLALARLTDGRAVAGRLGGDEYAVLVTDAANWSPPWHDAEPGSLVDLGHQLRRAVRGPFLVTGVPLEIEAAVGVVAAAGTRQDTESVPVLLQRAEGALRLAKRDRTGVETWTPQLETARGDDLRSLAELRLAIPSEQLRLYYQPLIHIPTGGVHGFEALVRWQHPEHGLLPPGAFLPQAERSDVIFPLTDWVLEETIRQIATWMQGGDRMPISVNLSAACLAFESLGSTVSRLLDTYGVPGQLLTIEVTESAVMTHPDRAAARLTALRELGARVSIDDFGTGYTSLLLLTQLPIDELKLDRAFVSRVNDSASHRAVVRSVAEMARGLGVAIVAEGIEDQATADAIRALGFDLMQGYFCGRPAPPTANPEQPPLGVSIPSDVARVLAGACAVTDLPEAGDEQTDAPLTPLAPADARRRGRLDALAAVAAELCEVSTGLIAVAHVDHFEIRGDSSRSLLTRLTRAGNPLRQAVRENEYLEVADASVDPRFAAHPLVRTAGFRFFGCAPIRGDGRPTLGALCVVDPRPRRLTRAQRTALETLARNADLLLTDADAGTTALDRIVPALPELPAAAAKRSPAR